MRTTSLLTQLLELYRYLAKLQVLRLKESNDPFATWNDSRFEDNMSPCIRLHGKLKEAATEYKSHVHRGGHVYF